MVLSRAGAARRCAAKWLPGSREEAGAGAGDSESTHLDKLRHFAPLLFRFRCVLLLHHTQPRYGQLELHFELVLSFVSLVVRRALLARSADVRRVIVPAASLLQIKDSGRGGRRAGGYGWQDVRSRQLLWSWKVDVHVHVHVDADGRGGVGAGLCHWLELRALNIHSPQLYCTAPAQSSQEVAFSVWKAS